MTFISRLLKERIIFLGDTIDDDVANTVIAQCYSSSRKTRPKTSSSTSTRRAARLRPVLRSMTPCKLIAPDVSTICIGMAASMASILLSAGAKGKRFVLPNSEVMIHQVMGGAQGQASDIEISARHILKLKERLNKILASHTGQKFEKVTKDSDRDYFMSAEEAVEYGLADKVIKKN